MEIKMAELEKNGTNLENGGTETGAAGTPAQEEKKDTAKNKIYGLDMFDKNVLF